MKPSVLPLESWETTPRLKAASGGFRGRLRESTVNVRRMNRGGSSGETEALCRSAIERIVRSSSNADRIRAQMLTPPAWLKSSGSLESSLSANGTSALKS